MPDMPPFPESIEVPGIARAAGAVTLDHMSDDVLGQILVDGGLFRDHLAGVVADADALVPDGAEWRIHITGDLVRSVNELDPAYATTPYTVERGANTVAGKTVTQDDGTFDVLISSAIWNVEVSDDVEQAVGDMAARVRHTFMHEAGHVAIDARGEDALSIFPSIDSLDAFEQVWSRHLGFMLEDYRIAIALASIAPVSESWVAMIGNDLAHFEAERARSHQVGVVQGDFGAGRDVMIEATVHLTRALAYLSAETSDPTPHLEADDLARWHRFVAPTWPRWVETYGLATPANEPMAADAVADVIASLAALAPEFMRSVGFERKMSEHGESVWWLRDFEW